MQNKGIAQNSFLGGMNVDVNPLSIKNTMLSDAVNVVITTNKDNQFILQNMEGNIATSYLDGTGEIPLAQKSFKGITFIISGQLRNDGELSYITLGTFPSPADLYNGVVSESSDMVDKYSRLLTWMELDGSRHQKALFTDSDRMNGDVASGFLVDPRNNFIPRRNVTELQYDLEIQESYDGSFNLIWTDGETTPKIINSLWSIGTDNKASWTARDGSNETNVIRDSTELPKAELLPRYYKIGNLSSNLIDGGKLLPGGYKVFLKYADDDGNLTDVFQESLPISVHNSVMISSNTYVKDGGDINGKKELTKSLSIDLTDLDPLYKNIKAYFTHYTGEDTLSELSYEVIDTYPVTETNTCNILISGYENIVQVEPDVITYRLSDVKSCRTISQIDSRLTLGNTKSSMEEYYDDLKAAVSEMRIIFDLGALSDGGMQNNDTFQTIPVWQGETYELGVVCVLKDGSLSPVFSPKGLDALEARTEAQVVDAYNRQNPGTEFDELGWNTDDTYEWVTDDPIKTHMNINGVFRTPLFFENTGLNSATTMRLMVDFTSASTNAKEALDKHSMGWFVVRKDRVKNCEYTGVVTPVGSVPIGRVKTFPTHEQDEYVEGETAYAQTSSTRAGTLGTNFDVKGLRLGKNEYTGGVITTAKSDKVNAVRYFPMPGCIVECGLYDSEYIRSNPVGYNNTSLHKSAFYSTDISCRPADAAGFFSAQRYVSIGKYGMTSTFQSAGRHEIDYLDVNAKHRWQESPPSAVKTSFVAGGIETVSDGSFGSKIDRDLWIMRCNLTGWTSSNNPWTNYFGGGADLPIDSEQFKCGHLGTTSYAIHSEKKYENTWKAINSNFAPYVGIDNSPDDQSWNFFVDNKNGSTINGNATFYGSSWTGSSSLANVQGYTLARIYNGTGLYTPTDWYNKYKSAATSLNPYFTASKRVPITNRTAIVENGDCFMNPNYVQVSYGIGILGNKAATDASAYINITNTPSTRGKVETEGYNLAPRGMDILLLHESNHNGLLRSEEFVDGEEVAIFGGLRSWYPKRSTNKTRQPDSSKYNLGFSHRGSINKFYKLNPSSPSLDFNYATRIMISEVDSLGEYKNGYRQFKGSNYKDYDTSYGSITRLITFNNKLYCIQENGISRILVNERTQMADAAGGIYIDSGELLHPKPNVISGSFGSQHIRSVVASRNGVYGIDIARQKIWSIVNDQLKVISDYAVGDLVTPWSLGESGTGSEFVLGLANFEASNNDLYFTFADHVGTDQEKKRPEPNDPDIEEVTITGLIANLDITLLYNTVLKEYWLYGSSSIFGVPDLIAGNISNSAHLPTTTQTIRQMDGYNPCTFRITNSGVIYFENGFGDFDKTKSSAGRVSYVGGDKSYNIKSANTLVFNESASIWTSKTTWHPSIIFNTLGRMFSMEMGYDLLDPNGTSTNLNIYEHGRNQYGVTYGKVHDMVFEFIVADESSIHKIFECVKIISNNKLPDTIYYNTERYGDADQSVLDDENINFTKIGKNVYYHENILSRSSGASIRLANTELKEDHIYIQVAKNGVPQYTGIGSRTQRQIERVRDKYCRIRLKYKGDAQNNDRVLVQAILTYFTKTVS